MWFGVLGPLEVRDDAGVSVGLASVKQRILLAVLLRHANETVSVDRLSEALWSRQPPRSARTNLQVFVHRLRRLLGVERIEHHPTGYRLLAGPGELDAAQAEALARAGSLDQALALWRGEPYAGFEDLAEVRDEAERLAELRLALVEDWSAGELAAGRHAALVPELSALAARHRLREGLQAVLMLALYRCGRVGEALRVYQDTRAVLVTELGLEPGTRLRKLQRAMLAEEPALEPAGLTPPSPATAAALPAPVSQLPPDVPHFTGRDAQLQALDALVPESGPIVVSGSGGVGKTTLAVRWAHRARPSFPGGQLYANLHGYSTAPPVPPIEVLARFLRALGVTPPHVPAELEEASALYRSLLSERRFLVVLDNARTVEQVRPLLPAGPGSLALVTSRDRLTGLVARDGARRLDLRVLHQSESLALLSQLAGVERVAAEPDAAAELAEYCAGLPLALRVTAAQLTDHTGRRITDHLAELRELRIAGLAIPGDPESSVRGAIDLSYRELAPGARRAFRFLGLVPGPDFTGPAVAALTGATEAEARQTLGQLAAACLLDEHQPGRYTFHDLLRAYAHDREHDHEDAAARNRLAEWYLHSTHAAVLHAFPGAIHLGPGQITTGIVPASFTSADDAMAWLDAEYANLRALLAATAGDRIVCQLAAQLRGYTWLRGHTTDAFTIARAGREAARRSGDVRAEAILESSLSATCKWLLDLPNSAMHLERAIALAGRAGWSEALPDFHNDLAGIRMQQGDLDGATGHCRLALALWREQGARDKLSKALIGLAMLQVARGQLAEAEELYTEAIPLTRESGAREREASATGGLTYAVMFQGRIDAAMALAQQTHELHRTLGNQRGEAHALHAIAEAHLHAGRFGEAIAGAEAMLDLAERISHPMSTLDALNLLASARRRAGDPALAADLHRRALAIGVEHDYTSGRIEALIGLARAEAAAALPGALSHAEQAVSLVRTSGIRLREGSALLALGEAQLAQGETEAARRAARAAAEAFQATGQRLHEAEARELLDRIPDRRPRG
ncbi:AfsR/SARP family transcriptional regulator [Longispora albida]|uniref:AfsR/SARP family transcriptional regulator n=1 Tax=Longispora albida TaxID=203523 RepID=UPI00038027FC|nr:AfsR/SARP family transcriptional regulator [Longispora albida]